LLAVAVAKALGASPVILTGTRNRRLAIGQELGADRAVNINDEDAVEVVRQLTRGIGADYVFECAGTEATLNQAIHMSNRGGKICLAAFPHEPATLDIARLVKNNIYAYGIRGEGRSATRRVMALMAEKRFDAIRIHAHTFPLADLPTALLYARDRVDDAIKVVVTNRNASAITSAAE
jgi:threonine dehydrogenase-like Zn-dependent dehydrogenase